jgi:hypothetical protein
LVKEKAPVRVLERAVAVDNCGGDDLRVVWVGATNCYGLAEKVDIAVAAAGICAGLDFNNVARVGVVDCCLDIIKISRTITGPSSSTVIVRAAQGASSRRNTQIETRCLISPTS